MDIKDIDPRLVKIIALAKHGVGGEKDVAIQLVRKICDRDGLDFDEVMAGKDQPKEHRYEFNITSKEELQIAIQVAARFATTREYPHVTGGGYRYQSSKLKWVKYTTTTSKHIETTHAIDVYLKAYRRERKNIARALEMAFTSRHNLYSQFDEEDDTPCKVPTQKERLDAYRAAQLSMTLTEDVDMTKQIGSGE